MSVASNTSFWSLYSHLCYENKKCPIRSIAKCLNGTELNVPHLTIRTDTWPIFLKALSTDNSLTVISLYANSKEEPGKSSYLKWLHQTGNSQSKKLKIGTCVEQCLKTSHVLNVLKLEYFPLTVWDADHFSKALSYCSSLKELSLKGSLDDNKMQVMHKGLKHAFNIEWVDFSDCALSVESIEILMSVLEFQSEKAHLEMWEKSLRFRVLNLDAVVGIRRITLNNVKFGNAGVEPLAKTAVNHMFLKALDLQNCDIGDAGARHLLEVLNANVILEVLDTRFNPLISGNLQQKIIEKLHLNNTGKKLMVLEPVVFGCYQRFQHTTKKELLTNVNAPIP